MSDVTQKIITQILSKCHKNGYTTYTPSLVHFIIQSIIISKYGGSVPNEAESEESGVTTPFQLLNGTQNSATLTSKQILSLIDQACALLSQSDSPKLATVLMQNALLDLRSSLQHSQDDILKTHLFKSEKLIDEIIKKKDEAEVFGDIVLFILHETRLLNDSTERIEKETMTALESVIPRNFIHSFITQDEDEKKNQLYDLWKIVWGIRLFNKASDKGGAGINRLTIHDPLAFQPLMEQVEQQIEQLAPLIEKYASVLQYVTSGKSSSTTVDTDRLRQEYTNKRQIMAFLKQIHKQLIQMQHQSTDIQEAMTQTIDNVHQIVNQRTSVPKSTIYPLFINLAESWLSTDAIQNQFTQLESLFNELQKHSEGTFEPTDLEDLARESSESEQEEDADPLSGGDSVDSRSSKDRAQRVRADSSIQPELGGFDPIKMVSGAKLLRDGDPTVDYAQYMNRYYAFETEESINRFLANPQLYLELVMETVTQESDLIHLLNLEERLPKSIYMPGPPKQKQMVNVSLQTEVHPLDGYIDPKYEWSEWKLRKLALKFANLRNKRTHSTQTHHSHFRRDGETQVDSKPDQPLGARTKDQQTAKENGTNPIQHMVYIKGLRQEGDNAEVVRMQFDPMDKQQ